MSRMIRRPVPVEMAPPPAGSAGRRAFPRAFTWKGRRLVVQAVVDEWYETGRWWDGEREKRFVQVVAGSGAGQGLYELYCEAEGGPWYLYRILD